MAEKRIKNELHTDYRLAGMATSLKEHKFCYYLNQLLGCDFKKLDPLVFEPKDRTRKTEFSVFKAEVEDGSTGFIVFANKNMGEFLLPEVSNFDYVLQVKGKFDDKEMKELVDGIKRFPDVMMCVEVAAKKIKSRDRLVYEEKKAAPARFKGIRSN